VTLWFAEEDLSGDERAALARYFTNLDGPVFALVNLPEVTKGALFARYSRSPKSLRRLFLDEFADHAEAGAGQEDPLTGAGVSRAEELYQRVFVDYGDDSVAQLGGVHLACEQSSQLLAKVLEWGRLAAYLEQSTRYVPYDDRPGGRWRYLVPPEVEAVSLAARYSETLDRAFETYSRWLEPMQAFYRDLFPQEPGDSDFVYRSTIRAKACDTLRGLLPASTRSNVGIYATGQSYEQLLLRMRANPLAEVRAYGDLMLEELRKVIPAFLRRVDQPDRGGAWSEYLARTREEVEAHGAAALAGTDPEPRPLVALTDFDPDGEVKVVAAALYAVSDLPDDQLLKTARRMTVEERARVLRAYVGDRTNRRHKPGRAFERTGYRFDVLCDYGAFRDLQRHRLLTIEWQHLSPRHGFHMPPEVIGAGVELDWVRTMRESETLYDELRGRVPPDASSYAVSMAYRIRFVMQMNAREAMHLIELRTTPQGHPVYRRVGQDMHRLIAEEAGHRAIADAMRFVDHSEVELERLEAERRSEAKRRALGPA
jgi:thymidylate synthase ThyX